MSSTPSDDYVFEIVEPQASPIMESLRAFGYSASTAVADLVDNSISAGASRIAIDFDWDPDAPSVFITDDGHGMSSGELAAAMRLGSRSPVDERDKGDLGRFGLGLKTASFSQSRRLTVVSRRSQLGPALRCWDLDLVAKTNEWRLLGEVPAATYDRLLAKLGGHGTVVLWEGLDRLLDRQGQGSAIGTADYFLKVADDVRRHLELVFHRFLERANPIRITVNGQQLAPWDPFMRSSHPTTTGLESIPLGGGVVHVQPFVLPHKSKLSDAVHEGAAGPQGWNASQGFYVYRNDRLLVGGSWLGVGGVKEEHTKLARIQLDIPSSLDHLWQVDVRKASIKAPSAILPDLRRIARATRKAAQEVYRFRGKQLSTRLSSEFVVGWNTVRVRDGAQEYRINRRHPLVSEALEHGLDSRAGVERLLRFVEETVPVTQIGIAVADALDSPRAPFDDGAATEIRESLRYLLARAVARGAERGEALDRLATVEPYALHPEVVQIVREEQP